MSGLGNNPLPRNRVSGQEPGKRAWTPNDPQPGQPQLTPQPYSVGDPLSHSQIPDHEVRDHNRVQGCVWGNVPCGYR